MSKTILITREIPAIAKSMLEEKGYVVDVNTESKTLTQAEIIEFLKQKPYDAVLCLLTDKIDGSVFEIAPTVKLFSNFASGFDNIDLESAKAHGVTVANAPTELTNDAVAEHVIAFILALSTRIVEGDMFIRAGKYDGWVPMQFLGTHITGKTIGLVGAGRIGDRVAHVAKSLGMYIAYTDVVRNEKIEKVHNATFYTTVEELLPQVDFVSLHVPLLPSTKHMMNEKTLRLMKPTAFLINTARGPIVDETALVNALKEKVIAGAGLDVFEFEPKVSTGLIELPNVILTPHIASADKDTRDDMARVAAQNIIDFFEGKELKNKVTQ